MMASYILGLGERPAARSLAESAPERLTQTSRPWFGIGAVLLGAFISTLTGRLSTFGLADIRGALGAGFDEGAWITSAQSVGQMLVAPLTVWAAYAFGTRRVLLAGATTFGAASFALPLAADLPTHLALQFVAGLGSGTFVPVTIGFIVRNLPPRWLAFAIAIYALNLEFSLHIAASIEGWYIENASWRWIFWQNVPLTLGLIACVLRGVPREPINRDAVRHADGFGLLSISLGAALLYAALDQGNRLDWWGSGLIMGLCLGGGLLIAAFFWHERRAARPWIDLSAAMSGNLPFILILIMVVRFVVLSTAFVIPQYLTLVRGFRSLDVGDVLVWIALPQLLLAPLTGLALRWIDPRAVAAVGLMVIAGACISVSTGLTALWGSDQFLPSQIAQAIGQSLAVSGIIFFAVLNLKPAAALTFGALLQMARLLGGELGLAVMTTSVRVQEQIASQLIGLHVQSGTYAVQERLQHQTITLDSQDASLAFPRALGLLARGVRAEAFVQSYMGAFLLVGGCAGIGLTVLLFVRRHATHPAGPLLGRR